VDRATERVDFDRDEDRPGPVELAALLDHVDTRPPDVRAKDALAFFKQTFEKETLAAEHEGPWQHLVAYRLTRLHLLLKNRLSPEDSLEDDDTPFDTPLAAPTKEVKDLRPAERLIARRVIAQLAEAPLPIEPPTLGPARVRWTQVHVALLEHLRVPTQPPNDYRYARPQGIRALIEAPEGRWPSREALVLIEEGIVSRAFDTIIKDGQVRALEFLKTTYGFNNKEACGLLQIAARRAQSVINMDADTARSLMLARLDELRNRAAKGGRMDAEMAALKAMAVILGLGKVDPEDATFAFNEVAKRITQSGSLRRTRPAALDVEARPVKSLTG